MARLKLLNSRGRSLVTAAFLAGDVDRVTPQEAHFEDAGAEFEPELLHKVLGDAEAAVRRAGGPAMLDATIAPALHQALPLDRRTAALPGLWHYLAVIQAPDFVRRRWGKRGGIVSRERFLGGLRRNALARLWWGAEVTVRGGDYSRTAVLLRSDGGQDLYEQLMGRRFSSYAPAVDAFLDVLGGRPRRVVRAGAEAFSQMLSTLVLESMSALEISEILSDIVERIEGSRKASPLPLDPGVPLLIEPDGGE